MTATGTASYGGASTAYTVQQQANSGTYAVPNIFARYTKVVPASGGDSGAPTITYSQTATYTSGATNTITSGATIVYKSPYKVSSIMAQQWYANPAFTTDVITAHVYDNKASGKCSLTIIAATNPVSINGGYIMRFQNKGSGPSPGLGGFYVGFVGSASGRYKCSLVAKVPKGYTIEQAHNSLGTNGRVV